MNTPARPSQQGVEAGLPQSGTYVTMDMLEDAYSPQVLNYLGDILALSPEQVSHTHALATQLAQSDTPITSMKLNQLKTSPLGRRLTEVVEIMREAKGTQGREVSQRAREHEQDFLDAMRLARDIRDTPTQQEVVANYSSTISTGQQRQTLEERQREYGDRTEQFLEQEDALPYETDPQQQYTGLADEIMSERQPFRAGMPFAPPIEEDELRGIELPGDRSGLDPLMSYQGQPSTQILSYTSPSLTKRTYKKTN